MKKILILSIFSLLLFSCGTAKKNQDLYGEKANKALNAQWILQDESGKQPVLGLQDMPITLEFQAEDGNNANGFAGCNHYGSTITISQNSIKFTDTYSTKMACPDLSIEENFFSLLNEVNNYKIEGKNLYLYKDNILLLHFKK